MTKKLLAGAVALCLAVPSTFAAWDLFPVIEQGSAEANAGVGYSSGFKIRYGLIDNLELFAASPAANCAEYTLGARYQAVPEMLSAYLDIGIPYENSYGDWGFTPGVTFSTNFTETISLGVGVGLPLHINHPGWVDPLDSAANNNPDNPNKDAFGLDLAVGLELDIALSEQVLFYIGADFLYNNLTNGGFADSTGYKREDNLREAFDIREALVPFVGFTFTKDNLSVGTTLGINLAAMTDKLYGENEEAREKAQANGDKFLKKDYKTSIGLIGGVDFGIKF